MGKKRSSAQKRAAARVLAEEAGDVLAKELTEQQQAQRPAREVRDAGLKFASCLAVLMQDDGLANHARPMVFKNEALLRTGALPSPG